MSNEHRDLLVQVETVLETIGDIEINFEPPKLDDVKAYLAEHGLVAISAELPREIEESFVKDGYQLREIVKLYSLMIAAQGEE
jgi:hypothetical protein